MEPTFFIVNFLIFFGGILLGFSIGLPFGWKLMKKIKNNKHVIYYSNWPKP
jgi:hypothetical protein